MYRFLFFIIIIICIFPLMGEAAEDQLLRTKIELLTKQVELLTIKLAILTGNIEEVVFENKCAQLEVFWGSVSRATGYRLYRDGVLIYEGRNRSFIDKELVPGKKYEYVVRALYRTEESDPSEVQEITAPNVCPPTPPRLFFNSNICGGSIGISWSLSPQTTVYQLYRGTRKIYEGPLRSFFDSRLTPTRSYEYKIRAGNVGGWGEFSDLVSFNASNVCPPTPPKVSHVTPVVIDEADVSIITSTRPADNVRARVGVRNQNIASFNLSTKHSSFTVARIDLYFDSQAWRYLDNIRVRYGTTTIFNEEITRDSFTSIGSGMYRLRIDNINVTTRKDRTSTIRVEVTPKQSQPSEDNKYITVFLGNNSIRGVDAAGFSHYLPRSGGGEGGNFSRTFYIQ